jgi:hypothetical protein
MTEKLTYDPTNPDAPEFTEDEQNSLEVAEKLGQEENELLAGKYENAEELEQAYLELQRKLGSDEDEDEVEDTTLDEDEVEYDEEVVAGIELIEDASQEYYNNEGNLTEETMDKFKSMSGENLVNAFMAILEQGNPTAIQIAVAGMKAEYDNAEGYEGRMLTGKAAQSRDSFRSQAEVVQAMSDPRYDRDPAYRQDLYDKLERSNVQF